MHNMNTTDRERRKRMAMRDQATTRDLRDRLRRRQTHRRMWTRVAMLAAVVLTAAFGLTVGTVAYNLANDPVWATTAPTKAAVERGPDKRGLGTQGHAILRNLSPHCLR